MMLYNSKDNAIFGKIDDPIREVLLALTGKSPPSFVKGYNFKNLTSEQWDTLHQWCVRHVKPHWATGIGLLEAAEAMVEEAVDNANIQRECLG